MLYENDILLLNLYCNGTSTFVVPDVLGVVLRHNLSQLRRQPPWSLYHCLVSSSKNGSVAACRFMKS